MRKIKDHIQIPDISLEDNLFETRLVDAPSNCNTMCAAKSSRAIQRFQDIWNYEKKLCLPI